MARVDRIERRESVEIPPALMLLGPSRKSQAGWSNRVEPDSSPGRQRLTVLAGSSPPLFGSIKRARFKHTRLSIGGDGPVPFDQWHLGLKCDLTELTVRKQPTGSYRFPSPTGICFFEDVSLIISPRTVRRQRVSSQNSVSVVRVFVLRTKWYLVTRLQFKERKPSIRSLQIIEG